MDLIDIINRQPVPAPWSEGEKIPWDDPGFSQRMLMEHLSQEHDAASRRYSTIDKHVEWIHNFILSGQPAKVLDLGCGPGLYTTRLARLGHECVGLDFSPASIAYAQQTAYEQKLGCTYLQQDIRIADYKHGYGVIMLIFGEFNTFRLTEARSILEKSHAALVENGRLLLEVHTFDAVRAIGAQLPSWYSSKSGLWSDHPHICLTENFWDSQQNIATERYFIFDGLTDEITRYAASTQAYTNQQYQALLGECSFEQIEFHPSLCGAHNQAQDDFVVIIGRK